MPKVKSNCECCGKEMEYFASSYNGHKRYCSRACQSTAARIWTTCPRCGKQFWYHRSWPRKFCSRACSAAVNAKANLGIVELGPIYCENCGKEITRSKWRDARFCSRRCFGDHLAKTLAGKPRPEVAGERPDLQDRLPVTCQRCGTTIMVKRSHAARRRFCSRKCVDLWRSESGIQSGANNTNWTGGYSPYYGPNWRQQRRNARRRDNYACQACGVTEAELGHQLDVHHIVPFRQFGLDHYREANAAGNLISLCRNCHSATTQNGRH